MTLLEITAQTDELRLYARGLVFGPMSHTAQTDGSSELPVGQALGRFELEQTDLSGDTPPQR